MIQWTRPDVGGMIQSVGSQVEQKAEFCPFLIWDIHLLPLGIGAHVCVYMCMYICMYMYLHVLLILFLWEP